MSGKNINLENKARIVAVAALELTPQSSCPIGSGRSGRWKDSAGNIFERDSSGNDTPGGGAGNSFKKACRMATAGALNAQAYSSTLLTLTQSSAAVETIDGKTPVVGDRVLVKNQADATQNGIYTVTVVGTGSVKQKLTRATDANESAQFTPGFLVGVSEGTANADSFWVFTPDTFVLDTNNAVFSAAPLSITYATAGDMAANGLVGAGAAGSSAKVLRADAQLKWGTDLVALKEVDHVVQTDASTTAATAGGAMSFKGGIGKTSGNGGVGAVIGGAADTTGAGGKGRCVGGAGGSVSGAGGDAECIGGAGTLNANGGKGVLDGGAKNGSGTDGVVEVGATNASAITFGRAGKLITRQGKTAQGASTDVIADPGTGVAIPVTQNGVLMITTAGAETNTLAIPTFIGQRLCLIMDVRVGGDRVITSAQAINQAGNTIMTFGAAADMIVLEGMQVAGVLRWRVTANDGVALS